MVSTEVQEVPRPSAVARASRHQAVMSSTAAHVRARAPTGVRSILRSVRIRASTGNAVMLMDTAMKSANAGNPIPGSANRPYIANARRTPPIMGTATLT